MAARARRRRFASPFVITVGAGLAACGSSPPKSELIANPPSVTASRSAAQWKIETVSPGHCTAVPCGPDGGDCNAAAAKSYTCIADHPSVVVIRQEGAFECAYNSTPSPPPAPCPPDVSCNPPPPQWTPVTVGCPDTP
jgi:hypothetical protein